MQVRHGGWCEYCHSDRVLDIMCIYIGHVVSARWYEYCDLIIILFAPEGVQESTDAQCQPI